MLGLGGVLVVCGNFLTLHKFLSLWFCFLLHSVDISNLLSYIQNISSNKLARPVIGTNFLIVRVQGRIPNSSAIIAIIGRAKRAPHMGVQSRFRVIYMCVGRINLEQ